MKIKVKYIETKPEIVKVRRAKTKGTLLEESGGLMPIVLQPKQFNKSLYLRGERNA